VTDNNTHLLTPDLDLRASQHPKTKRVKMRKHRIVLMHFAKTIVRKDWMEESTCTWAATYVIFINGLGVTWIINSNVSVGRYKL